MSEMKKYLIIKADTNDGDYVTKKSLVNDETLEAIKPMLKAIKKKKTGYNYLWGEIARPDEEQCEDYYLRNGITQEQFDVFDDLVSHGEHGIHTIVSVELLIIAEEKKLL